MEDKLRQRWSPQQISRRLIIDFPQDASMRVSHETIYSSQFVQTNAVLRTELIAHLRTRLVRRRPHRKAIPRTESRRIQNMVPLGERPEEVLEPAGCRGLGMGICWWTATDAATWSPWSNGTAAT